MTNLHVTVAMALPDLLDASVIDMACFLDPHTPQLHKHAIDLMGPNTDQRSFAYLRCLLGPPFTDDKHQPTWSGLSAAVPPWLCTIYIELLCKIDSASTILSLQYLPADFLNWDDALRICEEHKVFNTVGGHSTGEVNPKPCLRRWRCSVGAFW
jgi:vacuolar protein sorting-associated protein 8